MSFRQREEIVSEMAQSHKTVVPMAGSVVFGILLCNEHARKCLFKIICIWKNCNLTFFIQAYRLFHLGWWKKEKGINFDIKKLHLILIVTLNFIQDEADKKACIFRENQTVFPYIKLWEYKTEYPEQNNTRNGRLFK